jgi:predicted kinase
VILLVGLPGSGKSTWAAENGFPALSSDAIRGILADDPTDQSIHKEVFATLRYLVRQRIGIGKKVTCIDATHLTPKERRPYLRMRGVRVEAVYFRIPVELCKARNQRRLRRVPDEVIDLMAAKLIPPTRAEGFSRITVITPERQRQYGPERRRCEDEQAHRQADGADDDAGIHGRAGAPGAGGHGHDEKGEVG